MPGEAEPGDVGEGVHAAHFRELIKRLTGMTPAEYRAHFAKLRVRQMEQTAPAKR